MTKKMSVGEFMSDTKPKGGNADLFNIKEKGKAIIYLHPKSGIYKRDVHWVPVFGKVEEDGKPVDKVFMTMVIHEDVKHCLVCQLRKALRDNDEIEMDEIVLRVGEGSDSETEYNKGEIIGAEGYGWQKNLSYKTEYIFGVVEKDDDKAFTLIAPKSLGKKITKVIEDQIEEEGEKDGNPFENPYAFKITYDKDAQASDMYDAKWNKLEPTDEILEVLNGDGPDNEALTEITPEAKVAYIIRESLVLDADDLGLDLSAADDFDPKELDLTQRNKEDKKGKEDKKDNKKNDKKDNKKSNKDEDEEEEEEEEEKEPVKTSKLTKTSKVTKKDKDDEEEEKEDKKPVKTSKLTKSTKPVKTSKPKKKDQIPCPSCGEMIDEDAMSCPHCEAEFEEVEMIDCPECHMSIPADSDECPECGADVSPF